MRKKYYFANCKASLSPSRSRDLWQGTYDCHTFLTLHKSMTYFVILSLILDWLEEYRTRWGGKLRQTQPPQFECNYVQALIRLKKPSLFFNFKICFFWKIKQVLAWCEKLAEPTLNADKSMTHYDTVKSHLTSATAFDAIYSLKVGKWGVCFTMSMFYWMCHEVSLGFQLPMFPTSLRLSAFWKLHISHSPPSTAFHFFFIHHHLRYACWNGWGSISTPQTL